MTKSQFLVRLAALVLISTFCLAAEPEALKQTLSANRHTVGVKDGNLTGDGAEVIRAALPDAQYLLLGEDHGTAEIPLLAAALYRAFAAQGGQTLVTETGPLATRELGRALSGKDAEQRIARFVADFPFTVAFYNWQQETEFLVSARHDTRPPQEFHLIGLDQELMGSGKFLLQRVREEQPAGVALARLQALEQKQKQAYAEASKEGNPTKMVMMSADVSEFHALGDALRKQGKSDDPIQALLASRAIYSAYFEGSYQSNVMRAALMKKNFVAQVPPTAKAMFKFGAFHMFRGANPLRNLDVGNMLSELAASRGQKSLHVLALEIHGMQAAFGGVGKPSIATEVDITKQAEFADLKPLFDMAEANREAGWSLFDLRPLRGQIGKLGIPPGLERVVVGYDLMVAIPVSTPSSDLPAPSKP
jgi:hypothetical protein